MATKRIPITTTPRRPDLDIMVPLAPVSKSDAYKLPRCEDGGAHIVVGVGEAGKARAGHTLFYCKECAEWVVTATGLVPRRFIPKGEGKPYAASVYGANHK